MQVDQFESSSVPTNRDETPGSTPVRYPEWRWTNQSAAVTWGGTSPDVAVTETVSDVVGPEFGDQFEVTVADEDRVGVVKFDGGVL